MAIHAHSTPAPEDGAHHATRRALSAAIEAAIAVLDELDPDPDLEPTLAGCPSPGSLDEGEPDEDGEPTLGWPEYVGRLAGRLSFAGHYARALDGEAEDGGDREPSLAAPERPPTGWGAVYGPTVDYRSDQTRWADGSRSDREQDSGDEGEPDQDGEEALGWAANVGQLNLGQNTADGDETALERHGAGFLRSGGDDSEDSHDREVAL